MQVIYRIYQVNKLSFDNRCLIAQDVMECENRDKFKEAIRLIYGEKIKFKNTGKLEEGELFISIISYDCYNADEYLLTHEYICPCCGKKFLGTQRNLYKLYNIYYLAKINFDLYKKREKEIEKMLFCSYECKKRTQEQIEKEFEKEAELKYGFVDSYVTRTNVEQGGYIYIITKKSSGEFYVGQTNALPMFRWVQHLKTERFPIENIEDYKFEILETIDESKSILERETYWINKKRNENPDLCLNVLVPKIKEIIEN